MSSRTKRSLCTDGILESHLQRRGSRRSGRSDGESSSASEGGKESNELEHFDIVVKKIKRVKNYDVLVESILSVSRGLLILSVQVDVFFVW